MRGAMLSFLAVLIGLALFAGSNLAMAQGNAVPDFSGLWERPPQAGGRAFGSPLSGPGPVMLVPDADPASTCGGSSKSAWRFIARRRHSHSALDNLLAVRRSDDS
jgi:hypothetical protein